MRYLTLNRDSRILLRALDKAVHKSTSTSWIAKHGVTTRAADEFQLVHRPPAPPRSAMPIPGPDADPMERLRFISGVG